MEMKHSENAKVFKAFCDETRLTVLSLLQSGEKCACVLLERVRVGQPTLSHHMKILVDSGVVTARKEGKWTYYSISEEGSKVAADLLRELTTIKIDENDDSNKMCCEQDICCNKNNVNVEKGGRKDG
jgi:ArsR family transcriptional regulator